MMILVPVPPTTSRTTPPLEMIGSAFLHFLFVGLKSKLRPWPFLMALIEPMAHHNCTGLKPLRTPLVLNLDFGA